MSTPRILVIPGSQRAGSYNRELAEFATGLLRAGGVDADAFDLRALALPVYDGDLEAGQGVPASARTLQEAIAASDGLLIVTPEYNGFPTPLVINAFDWLSRLPAADGRPTGLATTADKPVALLAASPGPLGGLRSMNYLRQYLQMAFGMIVAPRQHALGRAAEAFDGQGALKDERAVRSVQGVLDALVRLAGQVRAGAAG